MKKLLASIVFIFSVALTGFCQSITNYSFSAYSGTLTPLTGATNPALSSGTVDEGYFNAIPVGFEFWYLGVRYTTISASTNGWLTPGSAITAASPNNDLSAGGTPRPVLAPLWDNLSVSTATNVSYLTSGTAGSRVFTLQYLNIKWQTGATGNTISFQVKLYEGTSKIEYIYRQETGALNSPSASIGISAAATGSGQFLSVGTTGTSVSSTTDASITAKPISGNTYSFTSPVPATPASLIFSTVNNTSMTLNWSDLSSNESGFVIYRSTDGVNYTFVTQTAANTTSSVQSGLTATTLYYWKIYSVSEGALSTTALSGSQTASCTPPAAPVVTSPVTYCQNASATALTATGANLLWGGASGKAGGSGILSTSSAFVDNSFNNRRTNFNTNFANVRITTIDYYIPSYQLANGLVLSIYNSSGTIIATSSTTTTITAGATAVQVSNTFNFTIPTAGSYSVGVSSGFAILGADSPTFPLTEPTGTIDVTGVTTAGSRVYNNIQFVNLSSSVAPTPVTTMVSQTVGGCISPQATIIVNVVSPALSQTPTANLIASYKFNGNASDDTGNDDGTLQNAPATTTDRFGRAGAAYSFNGSTQYVSTANSYVNPTNFTISIWFKTTTATGGKLIGFGSSQTGSSGQYDRHLYMNNAGQIYFGIYSGTVFTLNSTASYNDNAWHQAVGTLSSVTGMSLYVDGALIGTNTSATAAENSTGYWRIAYDNNNGWTSQPTSYFFSGVLDDALIYHQALTPSEVATIYNSPDGAGNNGPACVGSAITLTAKAIAGATYAWSGPNGFTSTSQNPTFTFANVNAGTYAVVVTVSGCSATAYTNVLTSTNAGQWTGNVSTDWGTAGNWCTGVVPTAATNVTITTAAARMPLITAAAATKNISISAGATLTTSATGTLSIAGTLTNSGTMTNSGTTTFNGTTGQQSFTGVSAFNNVTVNNSSGLMLPSAITLTGNLTLTSGILDAGNFNIGITGNWTNSASASAFTAGTGNVAFNGTVAQAIGGTFSTTFNNLIIASTNTVTLTTTIPVAGNLSVNTGTFDLASFTANRASAGGTLLVANGATLKIGGTGTFPSNFSTSTLVVASTVEYSGTNQAVASVTYGNLTLSSATGAAVKTMPATSLAIVGNFTMTIAAGTSVSTTAAAAITIGGSVNLGASTTFNGGSFSHSIGANWTNNGTYAGSTGTLTFNGTSANVSGSGLQNFNNVTVAATLVNFTSSTITVAGNLATTGAGSIVQPAAAIWIMSGTSKTISGAGIVFANLTASGTISTTASFEVTGNLSVSGAFSATAGTVTLSGAAKTISGAGTKSFFILSVPGSITTAADFTITSGLSVAGSLTATAGIATFTGTSTFSGTANLFNVTINGTSLQMSTNAILGIASAMTITAGTFNATSSVPNTVNFNGTTAQNINATSFSNLILSNGNTKTAAGAIVVSNDITIAATTTFAASSFTHTVNGNWINNGTFTAGTSTVQFQGTVNETITGATTFSNLTVNTASSTIEVILASNVSAAIVNMTKGIIFTGANTLTITNTRNGPGYIYGNIQRNHTFFGGTSYAFEGPDNTLNFILPVAVTSVTVSVVQGAISDFPSGNSISRLYTITTGGGGYLSATLRLHYEDNELNGNTESSMTLWHYNGGAWSASGKSANSTTANYVELSGISDITNRWTLSGTANVVQWNGSVSTAWNTAANWTVVQGTASRPPAATDIVYLGTAAFTSNPTISTAVTVKNIFFGSTQALTLSMAAGGSLTTGDVRGSWTANNTHAIAANGQAITINGNLDLSDGTTGHAINLSIGTGSVAISGSLTQSGGASTIFSSTGSLNIGNDFNYVNGTFTPATGTVTYNGSVNQTIGVVNYNNLTINKSAGLTSINNPLTVGGNLSVTAGELDNFSTLTTIGTVTIASGATMLNTSILHVGGNWLNSGTYNSNGTTTNVIFDGAGAQSISATTFDNLEFNKPVGTIATLTGAVTLKGNLTGTSGTLDIQSFLFNRDVTGGTATMANAATLIIGADNAPTKFVNYSLAANSTVIFNGTAAQHLALPGVTYGNIIFRNAGIKFLLTNITVITKLTIEAGATLDGGSFNITLGGDWLNSGTFTPQTSVVTATGTGKNITGNTTFNQFTASGSYTIINDVIFNGLLTITSSGSLSGASGLLVTLNGDLTNSGVLTNLGTTTFTGAVAQTLSLINAVSTVAVTVNFNGPVSPILNSTSTPQFGFLNINNTGGVNPSVDWNILSAITVGTGASFNTGNTTQNIYGSLTNGGSITSSGIINLFPASAATANFGSSFTSSGTGRIELGGAGAITMAGPAVTFNNLVISNTNASGITPVANWVVKKDFTLNAGSVFNAGSFQYSIAGNILFNGTVNSATSTVLVNGTRAQGITSSSALNNLTVNNSTGADLNLNLSVNAVLNFISGNIRTGSNSVVQGATGSVTGAGSSTGWVEGNLQKRITTGSASKNFEVGSSTAFTPLTLNFANVTTAGDITVKTTTGDHPSLTSSSINATKSVNRYWTVSQSGIVFTTFTLTANWVAGDVDAGANTAAFKVGIYNGTTWSYPSTAAASALSIQSTGVSVTGDFAIGENCNAGTTIAYAGSPYCSTAGTAAVTLTGNSGGAYSSTSGIALNASSGAVTLASTTGGAYTITYTLAANGGCSSYYTTANITVTTAPGATVSYDGTPYCSSAGTAVAKVIGSTGGNFTSTSGLTIIAASGAVDLTASTAGSYTVTYTIAAAQGCPVFSTTAPITITTQPYANGAYEGNPYCSNGGIATPTGTAVGAPGTLSSTTGLIIDPMTGAVNLSTSTAGTYTVTYSVPASGGCASYATTSTIAITQAPAATISYASPAYCTTTGAATVIFSGTTGGNYTGLPAGLAINGLNGTISPATSSGGTYTVTYTMTGSNGCTDQTATANVVINENPSATIGYTGSPYTIGPGTATVTLTGTTGGNFTSTAGLALNAANGSVDLSTSTGGTYTVTYAFAASACPAFSTIAGIQLIYNIKTWDGGAGTTSWGDANNWNTDGVPSTFDNIDLTQAVTINVNVAAAAHNININKAGLSVTVSASSSLAVSGDVTIAAGALSVLGNVSLKGNWVNNATVTSGTASTVTFNGAATEQISGSSITNFNNIIVTNTASPGVQVQANENLRGALTLAANVTFDADGSSNSSIFTLISGGDEPTLDASIDILPTGAQVTGNVTVQRYMTRQGWNNMNIYRYISSAVQSANVADVQNEIPVTGTFTGASTCAGCLTNPSLYYYDETVTTDINGTGIADLNDGYIKYPTAANTETFVPGRGYALYTRGAILASTLWDVHGVINAGNVSPLSLPVSYTSSGTLANDGWNLVGNPYPSTIDWNAASGWTKTNLNAAIYISDNGSSTALQYATWNGTTGTNGGSRYISTAQAFWVKATGSGTPALTGNENIKVPKTQTTFFRETTPQNLLRITLSKDGVRDEAVIHFRDDASAGLDSQADAVKFFNDTFNLSSLLGDGTRLAINSLDLSACTTNIPLALENIAQGNYAVAFSGLESFTQQLTILLEDKFTGTTTDLSISPAINFSVTADGATSGTNRFIVHFARLALDDHFTITPSVVCSDSSAVVKLANTQNGATYSIYAGTQLNDSSIAAGSDLTLQTPTGSLTTGINHFMLVASWSGCSQTIEKEIIIPLLQRDTIASVISDSACRQGAVTIQVTGAPSDGSYNWYDATGTTIQNMHTGTFVTPVLKKSASFSVTAVNANGCEGLPKAVRAEVKQYDDSSILLSGADTLVSNYSKGNQWYYENQPIAGAVFQSLRATKSGLYSVKVSLNPCTTESDFNYVVTGISKEWQEISAFPNPTDKEIFITVPAVLLRTEKMRIIDGWGRAVDVIYLQPNGNLKSVLYDMGHLAGGMYIFEVDTWNGKVGIKAVKK